MLEDNIKNDFRKKYVGRTAGGETWFSIMLKKCALVLAVFQLPVSASVAERVSSLAATARSAMRSIAPSREETARRDWCPMSVVAALKACAGSLKGTSVSTRLCQAFCPPRPGSTDCVAPTCTASYDRTSLPG